MIIGVEAAGRVLSITAEPEGTDATAQTESGMPDKKRVSKGKGKKGATPADSTDRLFHA